MAISNSLYIEVRVLNPALASPKSDRTKAGINMGEMTLENLFAVRVFLVQKSQSSPKSSHRVIQSCDRTQFDPTGSTGYKVGFFGSLFNVYNADEPQEDCVMPTIVDYSFEAAVKPCLDDAVTLNEFQKKNPGSKPECKGYAVTGQPVAT